MKSLLLTIIIPSLVALIATTWVFPKVLKLAKRKSLVDNPNARKLQKEPVPVLGGMCVYWGLVVSSMALSALSGAGVPMVVFLALSAMLFSGVMDDIIGLSPLSRLGIEIVAILALIFGTGTCVDNLHGLWGLYEIPWSIAVPLTIFGGVGIINAINMVDGVNGLSSGMCMIASLIFGYVFFKANDYVNAGIAFNMAAALFPFILYNVFGAKSKMFIGDSGTMMMGILTTWFVIVMTSSDADGPYLCQQWSVNLIALALAIVIVPVFDTLRVMTGRAYHHRGLFSPDRTHLHHMFIDYGVSHAFTSTLEIGIQVVTVAILYISYRFFGMSVDMQLYLVIALGFVQVWGTFFFLRYHKNHNTATYIWLTKLSLATQVSKKPWWKNFQDFLDRRAKANEEGDPLND